MRIRKSELENFMGSEGWQFLHQHMENSIKELLKGLTPAEPSDESFNLGIERIRFTQGCIAAMRRAKNLPTEIMGALAKTDQDYIELEKEND